MDSVTVYVVAYILGFSLPDGVEEVQLGDDLVIWNVYSEHARWWSARQHFLELGYRVEGGQNSLVNENLELEQALLPIRLYSNGDLQAFSIRHGNAQPIGDSEKSSISVSPGFPVSPGGRVREWGCTPLSLEQLNRIKMEYPRLRKSKNEKLEVAKQRFADSSALVRSSVSYR